MHYQYASEHYRGLLAKHGITCSMSRRANSWDNSPMESFFASLKKELVHDENYATRAEARASLFEYIEMFLQSDPASLIAGVQVPGRVRTSRINLNRAPANGEEVHAEAFLSRGRGMRDPYTSVSRVPSVAGRRPS